MDPQIEKILTNYIDTKTLVYHQIESFDDFIYHGIQRTIDNEPFIKISFEKKNKIYMIHFGDVYVTSPNIIEENREVREITPQEARIRNLSYEGSICLNIKETTLFDGNKIEKIHYRIPIARIPIMIYSKKCNLYSYTNEERINVGECPYDNGGYFIIKGNEKGNERVLICQKRCNYNQVYIFKQSSNKINKNKYKYIAETRSMSEETGHSVLIQAKIGYDDRSIYISIPYIQNDIPVGILFKALGYTTREEINNLIACNVNCDKYIDYILADSDFIDTQENAIYYMGKYIIHPIPKDKIFTYVTQVVNMELFPHLGCHSTIKEKAIFLGHMVNKLILVSKSIISEDDRDNVANKRYETTGILFNELFRSLYKKWLDRIKEQVKKHGSDIISIISKDSHITTNIKKCMATGNWGVHKNSYIRPGVSQVLNNMNYPSALSHKRRAVIPIGKEGKNAKIRQLHPSQIFFECPSETPEGGNVGIVTNFALLAHITTKIPTILVRSFIEEIKDIILIKDISIEDIVLKNKIILNGIIVGFTDNPKKFIELLRTKRKEEKIHKYISVSFADNEIRIFSDEGRLIRPLFTVNNYQQLNLTKEDGYEWDNLVKKDIIRYVAADEIESSVIAMNPEELSNYNYNYCEIHPTMMLGVCANLIPFSDHSQSPRNCYQSSMCKQALGLYSLAYKIRAYTISYTMDYPQRPLVQTKIASMMKCNDMPCGMNVVVAIACYGGYNQEDSIIMNKSSIERGLFVLSSEKTFCAEEHKKSSYTNEVIELPHIDMRNETKYNYSFLNEDGIIRKGVYVQKGDVLVGKVIVHMNKYKSENYEKKDSSLVLKDDEDSGYVNNIIVTYTPDGYKLVKVIIRKTRIPEIGDKYASREGQKGTCGMILNQEDMPFNPQTGMTPDIIINPHAFPSRMTISQLMECVLGKTCALKGEYGDATPFENNSVNIAPVLCENLGKLGFEKHGWERLISGITGEMIESKIFMGPTYYQRLKHLVSAKIHSRSNEGPLTTLTHQPLAGRASDGGLRSTGLSEEKIFIISKTLLVITWMATHSNCGDDLFKQLILTY